MRCTSFGYEFRMEGLPNVKRDYIEVTAHHPLMRTYLGLSSYESTHMSEIEPKDGSYEDIVIYTMRKPYEVLPGNWTIEIKYKKKSTAKP